MRTPLWIFLCLLALCRPAYSAVAFGAASSGNAGVNLVTNWTFNVTVPSTPNAIVLVGLCTANGAVNDITAATIDGDPLTLLARQPSTVGDIVQVYLLYRLAPTPGTVTVSLTLVTARRQAAGAIVLTGVHQGTPLDGTAQGANADDTTGISTVVATTTGDMLADVACKRDTTNALVMGVQSNRTERYNNASTNATSGSNVIAAGSTRTGSGSLTMDWSGGVSVGYGIVGTNVNEGLTGGLSLGFKLLQR